MYQQVTDPVGVVEEAGSVGERGQRLVALAQLGDCVSGRGCGVHRCSVAVDGPVGVEFKSIVDRIKVGRTMEDSLAVTGDRLGIAEFNFFCITLAIQRETGHRLGLAQAHHARGLALCQVAGREAARAELAAAEEVITALERPEAAEVRRVLAGGLGPL